MSTKTLNVIVGMSGIAFALALLFLPVVPSAHALTDAEITGIISSSTLSIDTQVTNNFRTVWNTVVQYTLLFGFVAVIGSLLWKGIRALMGRSH